MKVLIFMCFFMTAAAFLQAQIIHVPADYDSIHNAIEAATPGDTVLVADGVYHEQINFLGKKPLMVASQYIIDGNPGHINNTIIDGSQITDPDSASVVYFISGEDTTSILCGFTLTHGKGTYHSYTTSGGAIFIHWSGPKIVHNHITENNLNDFGNRLSRDYGYYYGAGICIWGNGSADVWTVIDHNVIDLNSCSSGLNGTSGGGIRSSNSNIKIINNTISGNSCIGVSECIANGASFVCKGTGQAIVRNNIIADNHSQSENNYANAAGGYFESIIGLYTDNVVENNEVITWSSSGGVGGLLIYIPQEGTVIRNNIFRNNTSNLWAGSLCLETTAGSDTNQVLIENNYFQGNAALSGGAFVSFDVPVVFLNNVFKGNHATANGGALNLQYSSVQQDHRAILVNNSFSGNFAEYFGGAINSNRGKPLIFNSIFFGDEAADGQEIYVNHYLDTLDIANSIIDQNLIYGNFYNGGGNFFADPGFADTVLLSLLEDSPCIDQGAQSYVCRCGDLHLSPGYDIIGTPRPQSGGYEIGAYEVLFTGAPAVVSHQSSVVSYPNPFSGFTTFEYELEHSASVNLSIYNHLGQQVAVLVNGEQSAGSQQVRWEAEGIPAGIYYYRLTTDDCRLTTGKLVLK